jgi:putrescine aminotransferase
MAPGKGSGGDALAARDPPVMRLARGRGRMLGMEFVDNEVGYRVATELFARRILISGTCSAAWSTHREERHHA